MARAGTGGRARVSRGGRRVEERRAATAAARPTSRFPGAVRFLAPANPQHIETRPRLMCYSFHVVEREEPRSRDLVEKRWGGALGGDGGRLGMSVGLY